MDHETVSAEAFGHSLRGVGLNLLTHDVRALAGMLEDVFGLTVKRLSDDFAMVFHDGMVFQLHADATFGAHPLLSLVPETAARGGGAQIYLFGVDPDMAIERAKRLGHLVPEPAAQKPHGLREATILRPEGYAFSPAVICDKHIVHQRAGMV